MLTRGVGSMLCQAASRIFWSPGVRLMLGLDMAAFARRLIVECCVVVMMMMDLRDLSCVGRGWWMLCKL